MGSDDDYTPTHEQEEESTGRILRRRRSERVAEFSGANSARKAQKVKEQQTPRTTIPTNRKQIAGHLQHIRKQLYGSSYDTNLSLRVVHLALMLQDEFLQQKGKKNAAGNKAAAIRDRVCTLLGVSSNTYTTIMKSFFEQKVYMSSQRGNRSGKETRIPNTKELQIRVRNFVRQRRAKRTRVTARQIFEFLLDEKVLAVPRDADGAYAKVSYETGYRRTRQYLEKQGYKRGRRGGNIVLKNEIAAKRDIFLHRFFSNAAADITTKRRTVFLDESYIHQHYHRNDDSVWDPNDEQDVQYSKAPAKGKRYCFLCAIQGPAPEFDHNVDEKEDYFALPQPVDCRDKPGVVPGSVWSFCPQAKGSHQGDYHKVFNSTNFVAWFVDQLLPNLSHPSLIVMDNASYHCTYPPEVPTVGTSKKADLVDYLTRKGVPIDPTDTVPILRSKAKKYIIEQEKKLCEQLALDAGHEVCYQPPHHSDFQPIELLWAKLKGNIGRKYNSDTTMAILKERLDEEFEAALTWNDSIGGMIRKTSAICRSFYKFDEDDNDAGNGDGEDPNSEDPIVDDDSSQISSESEGSE